MRAVQVAEFGGPEVLAVLDVPEPAGGPGHVVVDVAVAPVLFLDTQVRSGAARDWFPVAPPCVPGAGVAGVVVTAGEGVDVGWLGRRVVADTSHGGYLERAVVPEEGLIEVPDGLELTDAAALLHDGRTALGLAEAANMRPDEWVLVVGAGGGLGALLVQLARNAGARVIGTARGKQKLDLGMDLGADAVVDHTGSDWAEEVLAVTGGTGPVAVFDGVGGEIGRAAFDITARGGRFSAHGAPSGGFAPIDRGDAERRQVTVRGIEDVQFAPATAKRLVALAMDEAAGGRVRTIIGATYSLEQTSDAHRAIEGREVIGKTLVVI